MKKVFLVCLLLLSTHTFALPLGNPADPLLYSNGLFCSCNNSCEPCFLDMLSYRLGFYADFVFQAHLRRDSGGAVAHIEESQIFTQAAYLVLNFCQRVDLFATLGATDMYAETQLLSGGNRWELSYDTHFSWSLGARAVLLQYGCTVVGIEGQYFSARLPITSFVFPTGVVADYPSSGLRSHIQDWQVGLGLAHRVHCFVPYIGLKWSRMHVNNHNVFLGGDTLPDFVSAKKRIGFALGVTCLACDIGSISVEGRFSNEKACYVNGQLRF